MSSFNVPTAPIAAPIVVEQVDSSSSDEEETYTLAEAIESWYFGKAKSTIRSYRDRANDFIKWLLDNYNRPINSRLKKKHLRLYFVHKKRTCSQLRACVVCIKSLCRHLFKKGILKKDITISFKDPKQKPPKNERIMTPAIVKAFFREANKKKDSTTWAVLAVLTYGGLRITALSNLHCNDIKMEEHQANSKITKSYKIKVRLAKGGKSRTIAIKASVGANLFAYAQSLTTVHLFPGRIPGKPLASSSISMRIKRIAKKLGKPDISAHYFRHFMASSALHAGGNLVDISKALGHANVSTTSLYLHASNTNVSALIDLTESDGEDHTIEYVQTIEVKKEKKEKKTKKIKKKLKKKKKKSPPKSLDFSTNSSKGMFI